MAPPAGPPRGPPPRSVWGKKKIKPSVKVFLHKNQNSTVIKAKSPCQKEAGYPGSSAPPKFEEPPCGNQPPAEKTYSDAEIWRRKKPETTERNLNDGTGWQRANSSEAKLPPGQKSADHAPNQNAGCWMNRRRDRGFADRCRERGWGENRSPAKSWAPVDVPRTHCSWTWPASMRMASSQN